MASACWKPLQLELARQADAGTEGMPCLPLEDSHDQGARQGGTTLLESGSTDISSEDGPTDVHTQHATAALQHSQKSVAGSP